MKTLKYLVPVLFAGIVGGFTTACDNDEDNLVNPIITGDQKPNPSQVFTQTAPTIVAGMTVTRNGQGLVTQLSGNGTNVLFNYGESTGNNAATTRRDAYDARMVVTTASNPNGIVYYLRLNSNGYIEFARESNQRGNVEDYWFEYNSAGQLTKMTRTGDKEITELAYADGSVQSVENRSSSGKIDDKRIVEYLSSTVINPILNKGDIMLYDTMLDVDMDELELAYFAGMLGKSSAYLPLRVTENLKEAGDYDTFTWTLDANGLPTSVVITEYDNGVAQTGVKTLSFGF